MHRQNNPKQMELLLTPEKKKQNQKAAPRKCNPNILCNPVVGIYLVIIK